MSSDVTGTLRGFNGGGQDFRVAADANVTLVPSKYENSRIPNSGKSMRKMVARIMSADGVVLTVNKDELADLKAQAESLDDLSYTITFASKDEYKCEGSIEITGYESEEGRVSLRVDPAEEWDPKLA